MSTPYDVIVVGLGGMGSATARHLAARGVRVLGLERFTPAHDRGSSHGGSRVIRQSYFEDPAYVPLLLRAYELWTDAEKEADTDLLTLTGGLYLGPEQSTTFAGSLRAAQEWGLPHEVLDGDAVRARFPTITPAEGEVAVYEERAGFVRPEATVRAHLDLAARDGADLRFGQQVLDVTETADGVVVRTADGTFTAGHVVVSPGAWAPSLLADLGLPLRVERQVQYWFAPPGGVEPFVGHPVYVAEQAGGAQIYGFPSMDGPDGGVKVAFFRRGKDTDPDALDRVVTEAEVEEMRTRVADTLPGLAGPLVRAVPCMYTTTPDEHFVLRRREHVTIACGFSGHGFKFVPVIGEICADLATTGTTAHPIGLFDPERFG
ncbi:N-methyl-L-tryptophan oxidase [Pseudonocardia broussonetiae]|uniref:N-methyl-L-tryptophan oxidase n=1 Tax=Pseudonocardia broussonetiae TaxID=2736640 RepID=A0A6M6JUE4_9PSEU|nr:N-methyl-L-tryptophan oxidase [Pseudonocardia broussonetiae]QJY50089.1 N-methyl-L-tryptophan oxidase [Pseudonocardia broussonetiae]